ncbi:unnamed protein product, partial [Brassica oleracea var. botrytis]
RVLTPPPPAIHAAVNLKSPELHPISPETQPCCWGLIVSLEAITYQSHTKKNETIFLCQEISSLIILNEAYPFQRFSRYIFKLGKGDGVIRG